MKVLLLGLPGAGKSTVGSFLAGMSGVEHISIGEHARHLSTADTPFGNRLRQAFASSPTWQPLDDELAVRIAQEVANKPTWILDGFPRNAVQLTKAPWLKADIAIFFDIPEAVAEARAKLRGRNIDDSEQFKRRLELERLRLPSLVTALQGRFPFVTIPADVPVEVVQQAVVKALHLHGLSGGIQ